MHMQVEIQMTARLERRLETQVLLLHSILHAGLPECLSSVNRVCDYFSVTHNILLRALYSGHIGFPKPRHVLAGLTLQSEEHVSGCGGRHQPFTAEITAHSRQHSISLGILLKRSDKLPMWLDATCKNNSTSPLVHALPS